MATVRRVSSALPVIDLEGYDVDDLRAFLLAAEERAEELRAAVTTTRMGALTNEQPDATERRRRVAAAWVSAQQEATRIRTEADREATAITDAARRLVGGDPVRSAQPTGMGSGGWTPATDQPVD